LSGGKKELNSDFLGKGAQNDPEKCNCRTREPRACLMKKGNIEGALKVEGKKKEKMGGKKREGSPGLGGFLAGDPSRRKKTEH